MLNVYDFYEQPKELNRTDIMHGMTTLRQMVMGELESLDKDSLNIELPLIKRVPKFAELYARYILKSRWDDPVAEQVIMKNPEAAYYYALFTLENDPKWIIQTGHEHGRWPEAEPYIMKSPIEAFWYARDILKQRWYEAEPYIKETSIIKKWYCERFNISLDELRDK